MRYKLLVFLLITTILSACSINVAVDTPEIPIVVVEPATQTDTATPIIQILPVTETPADS